MDLVDYVLKLARTVYNDFVQRGLWDKCINATPGQSGLLSVTDMVSEGYTCFNCGKKGLHKKEKYPDPDNKERQKFERDQFNIEKGFPQQPTKFNNRGKVIHHKWRASEEAEHNKRVIDKHPYTYNPVIKGWVRDDTPASGATANLTTAQIELQELKAENERLKTDLGTLGDDTPEKSANYTWSQVLLNTTTPTPTKEQKQVEIRKEMKQLESLFYSL